MTWEEIETFVIGDLGYTYQQYANLTWREFIIKQIAFYKKQSKDYGHTRAICYYIAAVNRDPKKSFPSIEKFWPLPHDDENAPDEQEEYKRLRGALDRFKQSQTK